MGLKHELTKLRMMWSSESVNRGMTDNTMTKRKRTNNDLQNTTQKTKDRMTRTLLIEPITILHLFS